MADCCDHKQEELSQLSGAKYVLLVMLIINFTMFIVESVSGYYSNSSSLKADSLDMLGDPIIYGLSFYALGKNSLWNKRISQLKATMMGLMGFAILTEVLLKINTQELPVGSTISRVGLLALIANTFCAVLLLKYRNQDLNMRSTWLCTRNDVISNLGVICAGLLVSYYKKPYADYAIGSAIAFLVIQSSYSVFVASFKEAK